MTPNNADAEYPGEEMLDTAEPQEPDEEPELPKGEPYWAEKPSKDVIDELAALEVQFFEEIEQRGFGAIWRSAFAQFHGTDPRSASEWQTQGVGTDGEDSELLRFRINEFRSYLRQLLGIACGARPSFQASAANTDYASLSEAEGDDTLVNALYEQRHGEAKERRTVTAGLLYGLSWTWLGWDVTAGREIDKALPLPPEMGGGPSPATQKVRAGDLIVRAADPWDVIRDPSIEAEDEHLHATVVERRSRWELAAIYPAHAESIKALPLLDDTNEPLAQMQLGIRRSDRVKVRHWYHKKCRALPAGRYMIFVGTICLYDGPMPYDELPLVDFCPSAYLGVAFGYSDCWDLLPVNQVIDQMLSDIATNLSTFGRQLIAIGAGTDIDVDAIANGLRVLTLGPGDAAPTGVSLAEIPDASEWFVQYLHSRLQSLSGLNATARGEDSGQSGTHAALLHSIAVESQSALQLAVDTMRERVANKMLALASDFAEHPMALDIAGLDERPYQLDVEKNRLAGIRRVKIRTSNPLLRTQAGRMEVAEQMMKIPGAISDPAQLLEVFVTGQIKPAYQATRQARLRVRWENEQLAKGARVEQKPDPSGMIGPDGMPVMISITPDIPVLATDNPKIHVEEAVSVLANPQALANPAIVAGVLAHVAWHMREWRNMDPALAMLLGYPLAPNPQMPVDPNAAANPDAAGDVKPPKAMAGTGANTPKDQSMGVGLPKPAQPPPEETTPQLNA